MKAVRCFVAFLLLSVTFASAYGPTGHEIVGAIADDLLAHRAAGAKVNELLDGIPLQKAAVIPDEIKGWDKKGPDDPKAFPHYSQHPAIDAQLRDFWKANPPSQDTKGNVPSHHWFHYTDVPVSHAVKYVEGRKGRSQWDIVHMIPYCVAVLRGQIPQTNDRKITKPVAVILLAHYLGDIHQPLHVGAEYFDGAGQATDPDTGKPGMEDQGGNTFSLDLRDDPPRGPGIHKKKLHGFWDMDTVSALLPPISPTAAKEEKYQETESAIKNIARQMAASEPKSWRMPANTDPKDYAEAWADEILPIAREAHERLNFSNVHATPEQEQMIATGEAAEKTAQDGKLYRDWASNVVRDELHKAGWRLADLLEKTVTSGSTIATTVAPVPKADVASASATVPRPQAKTPAAQPLASVVPSAVASIAPVAASSPFGSYPTNYKDIVSAWLKTKGVNGATIEWQSEPKPADLPPGGRGHLYGYLVIFNTPAQTGAVAKTRSVLIRDGAIVNATGF